jgi:hypothetical protein
MKPTNNSRATATANVSVSEEGRERAAERAAALTALTATLNGAPRLLAAVVTAVEAMEAVEARRRARQGAEEEEAETRLRVSVLSVFSDAVTALAPVIVPALARAVGQAASEESELDGIEHRAALARARKRMHEAEAEAAEAEAEARARLRARETDAQPLSYARKR